MGKPLKVAVYNTGALYPEHMDQTLSGHAQVGLKTAQLLCQNGFETTLITSQVVPNVRGRIPPFFYEAAIKVVELPKPGREFPNHHKLSLKKATLTFFRLSRHLRKEKYDVVHFVGEAKTVLLAGLTKALFPQQKVFLTVTLNRKKYAAWERALLNRIDRIFALTHFTRNQLLQAGLPNVTVTRPGVIKDILPDTEVNHSQTNPVRAESKGIVLFWRDASVRNGVDTALEAFGVLAPEFKDFDFVLAVRSRILDPEGFYGQFNPLKAAFQNVHLFIFPYPNGITLSKLMESAKLVVMPFRQISINPQYSNLETLYAQRALITTHLEANAEMGIDGKTLYFIAPGDTAQLVNRMRELLLDPQKRESLAQAGKQFVQEHWNWEIFCQRLLEAYGQTVPSNASHQRKSA